MKSFEKCPVCGGELIEKEVEKLLKGGKHTAVLGVSTHVCLHCGERLYSADTIKRFEDIRSQLAEGQTTDFQLVGRAFQVRV